MKLLWCIMALGTTFTLVGMECSVVRKEKGKVTIHGLRYARVVFAKDKFLPGSLGLFRVHRFFCEKLRELSSDETSYSGNCKLLPTGSGNSSEYRVSESFVIKDEVAKQRWLQFQQLYKEQRVLKN